MTATRHEIEAERKVLLAQLDALKAERGRQALAGEPVELGDAAELAEHLDALDDAAAELTRQERREAQAQFERHRAALLADVRRIEGERLDAAARAEQGARQLVDAVGDFIAYGRELAETINAAGETVPPALHGPELQSRIAQRLSAVMAGGGSRLGPLRWPATWRKENDSWAEAEAKELESAIHQIIEGKTSYE